jgi:hypothetical protein
MIEVDDHKRNFVILGMNFTYISLCTLDNTFLNSNVGFMFDQYLQKKPLYLLLKYYQEGAVPVAGQFLKETEMSYSIY